jgi:hypothetical protein
MTTSYDCCESTVISMDQRKSHIRTHYIWHLCVLRVIVLGPLVLIKMVVNAVNTAIDSTCETVSDALPVPYTTEWVTFDQLSKREQRRLERQKERQMISINRMISTNRVRSQVSSYKTIYGENQ